MTLLVACNGDSNPIQMSGAPDPGTPDSEVDVDGDGINADTDCNDNDADIGEGTIWYLDADGDGYGDAAIWMIACDQPTGYVADSSDCNDDPQDNGALFYPDATEYCDGLDNNCNGVIDDPQKIWYADLDRDGYGDPNASIEDGCDGDDVGLVTDNTDCDDSDPNANPGETEVCDGIDNDCDGDTDDADNSVTGQETWYGDGDSDGYGDPSSIELACEQPDGTVENSEDCDDNDSDVHPDATEICDDQDNDCDGTTDEDDAADAATWYLDSDSDGFGSTSTATACDQPSGYADNSEDCDDADGDINPDASEVCDDQDNDCDGDIDEDSAIDAGTWYRDADGDSFGDSDVTLTSCDQPDGYLADNTDCDDSEAAANPGEDEVCDGIDNDCDGDIDPSSAIDASTWYADADTDGFGDSGTTEVACEQPEGYVSDSSDCDDTSSTVNPDATEVCDGIDNDCDSSVDGDDAADVSTWYADADGDSYGDPDTSDVDCNQPTGYVDNADDCDDDETAVYPGADEYCDSIDNNCDGNVDEDSAVDATDWYLDADSDGYGLSSGVPVTQCEQPSGYVADSTDCNDESSDANPGETEVCDEIDNNCDGDVDEASASDAATWYADVDSDGYGDASSTDIACDAPSGFVSDATDCDDTDSSVNPGAAEVCNEIDDDCDTDVDEGVQSTFYLDADSDGYGDTSSSSDACEAPEGYVDDDSDCDDTDASVSPDADEYCDGIDNDCDGHTDDSSSVDASTWYIDYDGDTYGRSDGAYTLDACSQPTGYVADDTDCDDGQSGINPGETEVCDEIDNNCDGSVDEEVTPTYYADVDGDGYGDASDSVDQCDAPENYVTDNTDCDDSYELTYPDAPEICDGEDNDCDGSDDENVYSAWYADADGDGYGSGSVVDVICGGSSGPLVDNADDCDDSEAMANPSNTTDEYCDGIDEDCDGSIDEDADCSTDTGDTGDTGFGSDTGDTGFSDTGMGDTGSGDTGSSDTGS
jgi:hypothetical protein